MDFGSIVMGIGIAMIVFNGKTVHERTVVSSMPLGKRNIGLTISSLIFSLMVWALTLVIGLQVSGITEFDEIVKMFILNSFIFTLVCCSLGFLVSQFIKNKIVLNTAISTLGLVLSFISGAFVPQAMLTGITRDIAQFTPTYWFVKGNELIRDMGTAIDWSSLTNGILIQLGFALAFAALALAVSRYKMERK